MLRRKVRQSIVIGDDIEITVTEVERGAVKLEIHAPRNVPVWRAELAPAAGRAGVASRP